MPEELKDLKGYKEIAIDLETNDPKLIELDSVTLPVMDT